MDPSSQTVELVQRTGNYYNYINYINYIYYYIDHNVTEIGTSKKNMIGKVIFSVFPIFIESTPLNHLVIVVDIMVR